MGAQEPQLIPVGSGSAARRIAVLHQPPAREGDPGLLWLIGLKSDMVSTKAEALAQWTAERGIGFTRLDYSGHGRSGGRFEDATLSDWLEESEAVFRQVTKGPQILVGSSTGAHVALLLLKRLVETAPDEAQRVRGLVLIAPAWDLTELMWSQFPEEARRDIVETGRWVRPSDYDPAGYVITRRFIEDGQRHLLKGAGFDPGRPVLVLQGVMDRDVPVEYARALREVLAGDWVRITEVADGEHRMSRPEDLEKLYALIAELL
ncbi:alpha/beta fold hydrolase [Hyphomicrobium sp.]|uniref:alpha/beta hydrolase n=1 Tax=Hyphomicrobium sp. TaxID=82 RepID=UPI0025C03FD0|nr:alpha/beta fold hydrolase [Hyphomicrobium sp.]MCC7250630.1 alpha/beta fold hydrolase [Hyphomicrobium sp.]